MRTIYSVLLCTCLAAGADLRQALTFHANFDKGTDAVVALGDKRIYAAPTYKEQDAAKPGLEGTDVTLAASAGRQGGALRFAKKNTRAVFYRGAKNVAFDAKGWTGTIAFWLSLDPETDLEPGFCDPIQITDKAYNDSAIWVDFTKDDKPRHFRLGVFGALKAWNPENIAADKNPAFLNRLVVVKQTPFARGKWTHVAITHRGLGADGSAELYLNGKLQGRTAGIREAFEWDMTRGAIRLGVAYVGLMDDVMLFRRALTGEEVARLSQGKW
ncbi:MAG: LamG domain-containing protein [Acidobacteria bacterium]|nr:LamG domain-containing protein [Acidobacteriota bacterium]